MSCKGKSKVPDCPACMEQLQESGIDAMERKGERIRNPPAVTLASEKRERAARAAKKKAAKRRRPLVVGKRVM